MLIISSQFAIILFHSSMVLGNKELLWTDVLHDTGVRDRLLTCLVLYVNCLFFGMSS